MRHKNQSEWEDDIAQRQRNVVFPDTAANEARFWRNIVSDKRKLSRTQSLGIAVMALILLASLVGLISTQLRTTEGSLVQRIMASMAVWIVLLAVLAAVLIVGQIVSRRSNR
jgi:Na+-transporting NADH:ubiquinone oxidoreductase subunit NqrE